MYPVCLLDWRLQRKRKQQLLFAETREQVLLGSNGEIWIVAASSEELLKNTRPLPGLRHQLKECRQFAHLWECHTSQWINVEEMTLETLQVPPKCSTCFTNGQYYFEKKSLAPHGLMSPELFWDSLMKLRKDCNRNDLTKKRFVTQELELRGS